MKAIHCWSAASPGQVTAATAIAAPSRVLLMTNRNDRRKPLVTIAFKKNGLLETEWVETGRILAS
jgi:hypothetical protein